MVRFPHHDLLHMVFVQSDAALEQTLGIQRKKRPGNTRQATTQGDVS